MKRLLFLALSGLLALASAAAADLPGDSIYRLGAALTTQADAPAALDLDRGHPTLVAMFYAGCPYVCPAIITGIQAYEHGLDPAARAKLRVLMISFDSEHDTPEALSKVAQQHRVDLSRWTFARAGDTDVRKIAAVLGVQYRRLPSGDYDHTALITLLDGEGRILTHTSKLAGDEAFAAQLKQALR